MSGKCYSCASEFGIFRKEHGCKNCGFGFCSKCVSNKIAVPRRNNEVHHVCKKCFDILTGKRQENENTAKYSPPAAFKKRMAALETKSSEPSKPRPHSSSKPRHDNIPYKGMSQEDMEIARRLEKLKEKPKDAPPIPSQQTVEERLAKLRGQDPGQVSRAANKKFYQAPDTRTQTKQTEDLLDEICSEIDLESQYPTPQQDIQTRLSQFKQQPSTKNTADPTNPSVSESQNDLNKKDSTREKLYRKNINLPMEEENQGNNSEKSEVDVKEMHRLIAEAAHDLELDAQKAIKDLEMDKDIQGRLAQLKQDRKKNESKEKENKEYQEGGACAMASDSEEDEEESIKKILKKALEENRLDEELEKSGYKDCIEDTQSRKAKNTQKKRAQQKQQNFDDDEDLNSDDEFPWCCICNADASLRCHGCDGDLYCDRCFKEGHDTFSMPDHKTSKFKAKYKTEQREIEEL